MPVDSEQLNALLKSASNAASLISRHVKKGDTITIISHIDADGLAAAGIMGKSLYKLGATYRLRCTRWINEEVIDEIAKDKPPLTIFTDLGSGYLDILSDKLHGQNVIILDHHQFVGTTPQNFIHVNPHLCGIDGSRDLSGAGVAYFVAKSIDKTNVDLSVLAIVGALGDLQDKYEKRTLGGANARIVQDAVDSRHLNVETDLLFFGRETRPIHRALALTTNPFIPGISGEEDKSLAFLTNQGIKLKQEDTWRALRDLSDEEKRKLCSSIADYFVAVGLSGDVALKLIGNIYTLIHEEPWTPLRDAREFTVLLNATGRMHRYGLGVAVCMGDRGNSLEEAKEVIKEYRRTITKYLTWITEKPDRIEQMPNLCVVHGRGDIDEKVISPLSSILSTTLANNEKPIIIYSVISGEDRIKVSGRGVESLITKGLNLGEVFRIAAEKHSGRGGGHDIAAGAQVPIKEADPFIRLVNNLVGKQLKGKKGES